MKFLSWRWVFFYTMLVTRGSLITEAKQERDGRVDVKYTSPRDLPNYEPYQLNGYDHKCEKIEIDYCKNFGYNFTRMPNTLGMERQIEAKMQLDSYKPLVESKCSDQLLFFLCATYLPMCHELRPNIPILPCEGWCWQEYEKCNHVLNSFSHYWPEILNCSQFPARNGNESMCMEGKKEESNPSETTDRLITAPGYGSCRFE